MPSVKIMFSWLTSYWWTPESIPLPPPLPTTPVKVVSTRPLPIRSQSTPLLITPQEIGVKRRTLRRVSEEEKRKYTPTEQPVFNYTARLRRVPETSKDQYRQSLSQNPEVEQVKNVEALEKVEAPVEVEVQSAEPNICQVPTNETSIDTEPNSIEVSSESSTTEVPSTEGSSEDTEATSEEEESMEDHGDNIYPVSG